MKKTVLETALEKAEALASAVKRVEEITGKSVSAYNIKGKLHWASFDRPDPAVTKTTVQTTEVHGTSTPQ